MLLILRSIIVCFPAHASAETKAGSSQSPSLYCYYSRIMTIDTWAVCSMSLNVDRSLSNVPRYSQVNKQTREKQNKKHQAIDSSQSCYGVSLATWILSRMNTWVEKADYCRPRDFGVLKNSYRTCAHDIYGEKTTWN